jgi:hypothetical protein
MVKVNYAPHFWFVSPSWFDLCWTIVPKTLGINGDLLTKSEATHELRETCNFKHGSATCCLAGVGCRNGKRRVVTSYKFQNNFPTNARKYVPFPSRVANSRPNARNTPIDVTPMFADFWPSCPVQNNDPLDAAGAFHMPKPRAHADASCDWTRQHLLQKTSRTASKLEVSRGLSMSPWCHVALLLPGVLQKAVAEVSKIRNLKEMWIVVMHGWQSEPTWWTERWLWLCVCPSLSLSFYNSLRHPLCVSLCLSLWLSIYLSIILSVA